MALISPQLLEILVCPVSRQPLVEDEAKSVLRCEANGREYPVREGIPIMLVTDELVADESASADEISPENSTQAEKVA